MNDSEKPRYKPEACNSSERDRAERFLALHAQNQHRLAAFVHTLVPSWQDAEELIQDTLMILWRKFDEFDPDTEFFPWAARVAQFEVLNYRRKKYRQTRLLDADVLTALATTAVDAADDIDRRREALAECVKQLPERDRMIVCVRYGEEGTVQAVAEALERSTNHVHRLLRNVRGRLLRCINRRLSHPAV